MLKRKKVKPITLRDVTIIDDGKLRKAITAASLGNAMEWFDFGVYGFVAYALGKVFFPGADPSVQMVAALATFSVPFLIRPLGGLFFGMLGDKYGRQKIDLAQGDDARLPQAHQQQFRERLMQELLSRVQLQTWTNGGMLNAPLSLRLTLVEKLASMLDRSARRSPA